MSGVFFYTLLLSFASGIFLRSFFVLNWWVTGWFGLLTLALFLWACRKAGTGGARAVVVVTVLGLGVTLGLGRFNLMLTLAPAPVLQTYVGEARSYTGQIQTEPELREGTANLVVQIGDERVLVKTDRHTDARYGDTVNVTGKLMQPESFTTDTGREFDYPGYLRARGITYTMSFAAVAVTDSATGNPLLRILFSFKSRFVETLQLALPEPEVGLGTGLLLGVKQSLGADLETSFRRAGIIHIVVLSGYNIMIIVGFVMVVLSRLLPLRAQIVAGVVSVILFALVVGAGASVVRASIMAVLGLLALLGNRRYAVLRALCLAGAVMLMCNPYLLVYDVGFQLSFMATLGLLIIAPEIEGAARFMPTKFGLREFLLATVATQIAVLPILLYHMGEFSLIAIAVNLLVLPIVPVAMLLTFLTGLVALVSLPLALPVAYLAYEVLAYIIAVATKFAALPYAVVTVPLFPWWGIPLVYGGFGLIGYWCWYQKVRASEIIMTTVASEDLEDFSTWTIIDAPERIERER